MTPVNPLKKVILIVDSDPENRVFLKECLEPRGFEIHEADDPVQAFQVLESRSIGIVIVDLEQSFEERRSFIAQMQNEKYGSPGVFLLVAASSMTREEAYDVGAVAALSKPVDPSYLASRLDSYLVPPPVRWRKKSEGKRPRHQLALSLSQLRLGRGGISLHADKEVFEGESVEFNVEVNDNHPWRLKGTGIVRYIKLDHKSRRQKAWGIEFETLDETSVDNVVKTIARGKPVSYIPKFVS